MKSPDRGVRKGRDEFGQSRGSRDVWQGEVIDMSGSVDEWDDKLEEGEIDEGEDDEGRTIGVGEDVKEEFGREARKVEGLVAGGRG
jgi:hypothetical protein